MRLSLIIGLVLLCTWLLSERHSLQGQIANVESKLETSRKQTAELDARLKVLLSDLAKTPPPEPPAPPLPPPAPVQKPSWLDYHIEQGSRSLDPATPRPAYNVKGQRPRSPYIPGNR